MKEENPRNSKNILIRNLTEQQQTELEKLKKITGRKTGTGAILSMLTDYRKLKKAYTEEKEKNEILIKETRIYKETFENIKFQVSYVESNTN